MYNWPSRGDICNILPGRNDLDLAVPIPSGQFAKGVTPNPRSEVSLGNAMLTRWDGHAGGHGSRHSNDLDPDDPPKDRLDVPSHSFKQTSIHLVF